MIMLEHSRCSVKRPKKQNARLLVAWRRWLQGPTGEPLFKVAKETREMDGS